MRIFYLLLMGASAAWAQEGLPDPVFDRIPFERWLKGGEQAPIRWSMRMPPRRLTVQQRLSAVLSIEVDGAEFVKRKEPGRVVVFMEIRDQDNRVFQSHRAFDFEALKKPTDLAAVNLDQHMFITPGDYRVAAAIYDTETREHSLKQLKLHVGGIPHDPLPDAWRNLPEVEFVTVADAPDRWYMPEVTTRLSLPVSNARPVRVEVVVNESPTEMAMRGTGRANKRNMGNLIPALKAISQMQIGKGSVNVTLLDLERRKVSFSQEEVGTLDWTKLRAALLENDPNQIDVHALANHEQNAQFFVSEIRKRMEGTETNGDVPLGLTAEPAQVLIVLSGPMAFSKGQDLRPIEAAPEPGSRVFYIRYYPPIPIGRGAPAPGMAPSVQGRGSWIEDALERTLKPLAPRLFNVSTPMEFRAALAAIMSEISQLK